MFKYKFSDTDWIEVDADSYTQDVRPEDVTYLSRLEVFTNHEYIHVCGVHFRSRPYYDPDHVDVGTGTRENWRWRLSAPNKDNPLDDSTLTIRHVGDQFDVICQTKTGMTVLGASSDGGSFSTVEPPHPGCDGQGAYNIQGGRVEPGAASIGTVNKSYSIAERAGCDTRFYKNGELVLALLKRRFCPEIEKVEECPENTCKVDCDTHYCCYGSDGVSIFSYEKN